MKKKETTASEGLIYIEISFILWLLAEFITVWSTRVEEWMSYMPWALFQYLFIILIFWFFLFNRNWKHRETFIIMIIVMYVFELILWQNVLLLDIIWFIPTSILLIQMWGFLTFIPFWIVNESIKKNARLVMFYCLWPVLGFVMALLI